jgi:hypothetical protein
MAFLAQPLPADLLHLLVEGEWVLAAPPRADAGGDNAPIRHRFEAEGVDVWLARDTGVSTEPLEAVARNLERREATVERSNVGGYHSHTDLFDAFPRATHAARQATETAARALGATICVEINQCVGCTRQFFTKSCLGDDAAVLARSSGEEPTSPRHRAGIASMAWRSTRRISTNAP